MFETLNTFFADSIVLPLTAVLFFDVSFGYGAARLPVVVLWLGLGAIAATLRFGFVNVRAFRHALDVTRGKFDDPNEPGEVSHFQALATALSGTLGLGNISGVAIAIAAGGPGAMFWMSVAGFFGMSAKFVECTLGVLYRHVGQDGRVLGGPMQYLSVGLSELGRPRLGKALAVAFSLLCIGGSLGGGNMLQSNQAFAQVAHAFPRVASHNAMFGFVLAALVSVVLLGGVRSIARVSEHLIPFVCLVYVLGACVVFVVHFAELPRAAYTIVREAFCPKAAVGGALGALMVGFKRAGFSNEAGIGSASIAHSAAQTKEPVREGIVALLEPFIDTIVVCNATALVVVVTRAYEVGTVSDGILITSRAFESVMPWSTSILAGAVVLFAYATILSWSYYGERCSEWLFGDRIGRQLASRLFQCAAVLATFLGPILHLGAVLDFSDLMILGMAFPNLIGLALLAPKVRQHYIVYAERYGIRHGLS